MESVSDLTEVVCYTSLIIGAVAMLGGVYSAIQTQKAANAVAKKAKAVADAVTTTPAGDAAGLSAQGSVNSTLESMAKLATSMKDLDVGSRFGVLGVTLYAIAAVAAGLDAVAQAIAAP